MATQTQRTKSERLEIRTTVEDRALIDRAIAATGTDLTEFVTSSLTVAAQRILADRNTFVFDEDQQAAWEQINERPARDLPSLRALMARPTPFTDE